MSVVCLGKNLAAFYVATAKALVGMLAEHSGVAALVLLAVVVASALRWWMAER